MPLLGIFNGLVARAWTAWLIALLTSAAYGTIACAEALRILPYAPDVPALATFTPSVNSVTFATFFVAALTAISTATTVRIARAPREANERLQEERRKADALLVNVLPAAIAARLKEQPHHRGLLSRCIRPLRGTPSSVAGEQSAYHQRT